MNMKVKVIYRKNLKMSEGKVAAQVAHAVKNLGYTSPDCDIVVLKVSDKKFNELTGQFKDICYIHYDKGLTEVKEGTATAAAWIESQEENPNIYDKLIREWFEELDEPYRTKALNNHFNPESSQNTDIFVSNLNDAIVLGFRASKTPEGIKYWQNVYVEIKLKEKYGRDYKPL